MDNSLPKVSIVLPTFNGIKYLKQSIDSCLNQSYRNIELTIVDDCSTDDTPNLVKSYTDARIKYIRNRENRKIPASLNIGFSESVGEYFSWTSDDNFYHLEAIQEMVTFLKKNKQVDFVYSDYYMLYDNNSVKLKQTGNPNDLFISNIIGASFLYSKIIYEKLGGYQEDMFLCEDYEYWLRILNNNFRFERIPKALYYYRKHASNLSSNRYYEVLRKTNKLRKQYIMTSCNLKNKEKGRLFFEIAKHNFYEPLRSICVHNLLLAIMFNPALVFYPFFLKLAMKILIGKKTPKP